jgi:hypothetical protein
MSRELLYTWTSGKERVTHAGYAVYTVRPPHNKPADMILKCDSAEQAVSSAERLGVGHGAFRITDSKRGMKPREQILRRDLPVTEVLRPSNQET